MKHLVKFARHAGVGPGARLAQRKPPAVSARSAMQQRGFTLIEAVMVIVITAIIAAVVAVFIRLPVQGYFDAVARAELVDVADLALRRMSRDMRLALPNSIRVSADGRFLELLMTKAGGRYLAEEDNPGGGNFLRFGSGGATSCAVPANCLFDVVGSGALTVVPGESIVVYNLGPDFSPADAYAGGNRAVVASVNGTVIAMTSNPFANQTPVMSSPTRRFQVVTMPVTYFCNGAADGTGTLTRYWGYAIQATQPVNAGAAPLAAASNALLANGVISCRFDYVNVANVRSGLVGLTLTLTTASSESGTVVLTHQVHVDNTP